MREKFRFFGIVTFVAIIGFLFVGCPEPNQTPVAGDYTVGNLNQTAGSVTAVTITANSGKSTGAVINVRYNGNSTIPQAAGTYAVTFDVAAITGWNAVIGLFGGTLTVHQAIGNFLAPSAINTTYTPTLTLENLSLPIGYKWDIPSTSLNAGNDQQFPATYTDPYGNYTTASGNIIVNIARAIGAFVIPDAINITYTPTLMLENLPLPLGYVWNNPLTSLNAGDGQLLAATYIEQSGNFEPASGNIIVNIAKATGITVIPPTIVTKTINSIIINPVSIPNEQFVEYAINAYNIVPENSWQTDLTFYGLLSGATYYIFARSAENDNYSVGTAVYLETTTLGNENINIIFLDFADIDTPLITAGIIYLLCGAEKPTSANITIVNPEHYDNGSIMWYLNKSLINSGVTGTYGEILTINSTLYNRIGQYSITVEVMINGKLYSKIVSFEVKP